MKPLFHTSMVNGPFSDPVLYVEFMFNKKALLFDLGDIARLSPGSILKVSHVFVTHTHMDHFIGFDYLLRLLLGRDQTLTVYGPPGIINSVQGKLSGYSWNLVGNYRYPFLLKVCEIREDYLEEITLVCGEKFAPGGPLKKRKISNNIICEENQFMVKAVALDHKISSIGYLLKEQFHINVNKEKLEKLGLETGPWISELKDAVYTEKPYNYSIKVPVKGKVAGYEAGFLKNEILTITPGQKIGYIVDCDYTPENYEKIVSLINGVDLLYIEAAFIDDDKERARETAHLTAKEAGELARAGGAKKIKVVHFSSKYTGTPELLEEEAQRAFEG